MKLVLALAFWAGDPSLFFDKHVAPILLRRCMPCHNQQLKNGGIAFDDSQSLLKSGSHGPILIGGKPQESYLLQTLRHTGDIQMPPGRKLPPKEIKILTEWIQRGAIWGSPLKPNQ